MAPCSGRLSGARDGTFEGRSSTVPHLVDQIYLFMIDNDVRSVGRQLSRIWWSQAENHVVYQVCSQASRWLGRSVRNVGLRMNSEAVFTRRDKQRTTSHNQWRAVSDYQQPKSLTLGDQSSLDKIATVTRIKSQASFNKIAGEARARQSKYGTVVITSRVDKLNKPPQITRVLDEKPLSNCNLSSALSRVVVSASVPRKLLNLFRARKRSRRGFGSACKQQAFDSELAVVFSQLILLGVCG